MTDPNPTPPTASGENKHRTALVTGASKGIGRELTRQLTLRGVRVFATGRNADELRSLIEETGCQGDAADLSNVADTLRLYLAARAALGRIDVLINNAGFNSRKAHIAETNLEEFEAQYAVNLRAPYLLCREAMKDMVIRRSGHLINVISTCALHANETMGVYTTMKSGLRGLTGILIKEASHHRIKVTGVYPGGVNTGFRDQARDDYLKVDSVAKMIVDVIFAPDDVVVHELTFCPFVEKNF